MKERKKGRSQGPRVGNGINYNETNIFMKKLLYEISKILKSTDTSSYDSNTASSVTLTTCTACIPALCLVAHYSPGNLQLL